ncbi:GDSL esterase/lipase EXL3-like [Neltuma alba]|uniref:GDSL esterase/lipase EXL3-like n=1 Tax=Neltuma alba TaxID=207710 RepID=UPI0010A42843|nr:GDSL esterase/lipase EXL3-like [Prosopis alba]
MDPLFQNLLSQIHLTMLWFSAIAIIFEHSGSVVSLPNNETIPAVFAFGDSIVDPGNNNYINTLVKCNFPPYGRDFAEGNRPTGRFSNGLVPSDIIAGKFGVKKLLPAYLDPSLHLQDLLTGVSFASGGAGYDPITSELMSVIPLSDQLNMFKEYIKKIKDEAGESRTAIIISKSVYVVCIGSDDIANTYVQTPIRRIQYDIPSYTDLMASQASHFLQELYGIGARRIGVFGITAIGCMPSQRTIEGGILRECSYNANLAALLFNSKLTSEMDALNKRFPESRLVYLDVYNPLLTLLQNPFTYGFKVTNKGCCGTGNIEVGILCNPYSINTCTNSSDYVFWDSYHPTEKAYHALSSLVLDDKIKDFF